MSRIMQIAVGLCTQAMIFTLWQCRECRGDDVLPQKRAYFFVVGNRDRIIKKFYGVDGVEFVRDSLKQEQLHVLVKGAKRGSRPHCEVFGKRTYSKYLSARHEELLWAVSGKLYDFGSGHRGEVCEVGAESWLIPDTESLRKAIKLGRRQKKLKVAVLRMIVESVERCALFDDARRLTRRPYYASGHLVPPRQLVIKNGKAVIETWTNTIRKRTKVDVYGPYRAIVSSARTANASVVSPYPFGRVGLYAFRNGGIARVNPVRQSLQERIRNPFDYLPAVDNVSRREALRRLKKVRGSFPTDGQINHGAPLVLLGIGTPSRAGVGAMSSRLRFLTFMSRDVIKFYEKHRSSLRALVELEQGLLERDLGSGKSEGALAKAVTSLRLENLDFREDLVQRKQMAHAVSFVRPEVALLFIVAEDSRRAGRTGRAAKLYRILLKRAPASPYAWESLVRMRMLADVKNDEIKEWKSILLRSYPCVWGYSGTMNALLNGTGAMPERKDDFAIKHLPKILKAVEDEVRVVDAWVKRSSALQKK